ncbi:MAG: hypothetical protein AABN95_19935 [Acidobacteriota bacterium]
MGLDTIELVIGFEEAFGIAIPDEVAAQLTTPGKVTDYVMAQVVVSEEPSCLSQQAFYFLRRTLIPSLNIPRTDLAPSTRLEDIIPLENRRMVWAGLKSQIGPAVIPDLARPIWLFALLSFMTAFAFISALIHTRNNLGLGANVGFYFGLLTAVFVGYGGTLITRRFKRNFRPMCESLGDLAKHVSVHSPHIFKTQQRGWTREQVAAVVREIIIAQLGRKDFTEDSHFIDDMHLN